MFETADGVSPRWQKLRDLVLSRAVGDQITYGDAMDVLCTDSRRVAQQAMRDAVHHLEKAGERTVATVARFGWVVVDSQRELAQVERRLTKTRRAAARTSRGASALATRRGELSQFDRQRLDEITRAAAVASRVAGRRALNMEDLRKEIEGTQK